MKQLEKLRDELACDYHNSDMQKVFKYGFDAATKELMRVIEIQRIAIEKSLFAHVSMNDTMFPLTESQKLVGSILNGDSDEP